MALARMHWRRLDLPGEDRAELKTERDGYRLIGHARYTAADGPVDLHYSVLIDQTWVTRSATVRGSTGAGLVLIEIAFSSEKRWILNGRPQPSVSGCIDVDLGFTPATNMLSLRRLALQVGDEGEVTAAWLPFPSHDLQPLRQVYARKTRHVYSYSCPQLPFQTTLKVDDSGFVEDYPPLWEAQPGSAAM